MFRKRCSCQAHAFCRAGNKKARLRDMIQENNKFGSPYTGVSVRRTLSKNRKIQLEPASQLLIIRPVPLLIVLYPVLDWHGRKQTEFRTGRLPSIASFEMSTGRHVDIILSLKQMYKILFCGFGGWEGYVDLFLQISTYNIILLMQLSCWGVRVCLY